MDLPRGFAPSMNYQVMVYVFYVCEDCLLAQPLTYVEIFFFLYVRFVLPFKLRSLSKVLVWLLKIFNVLGEVAQR